MRDKRLAGILGRCTTAMIAIVALAGLQLACGEGGGNTAFHINVQESCWTDLSPG